MSQITCKYIEPRIIAFLCRAECLGTTESRRRVYYGQCITGKRTNTKHMFATAICAQLTMASTTAEPDSKKSQYFTSRNKRTIIISAVLLIVIFALINFRTHISQFYQQSTSLLTLNLELVTGEIHWHECVPAVDNVDCGRIIVPKDYFNAEVGTASIALARYKAKKFPRRGSVFLNPGGPGGAGTKLPITTGSALAKLIGDDWDLIGFDPRGIGSTRPATRCFSSQSSSTVLFANTVIEQGITVSSIADLSSPLLFDELVEQHRQFLAVKEAHAKLCGEMMGDELRYMGTATVVRDIDFMSKTIEGEDEKINYWGISYGSILGAYLVNMLPHRIGYTVIDGIVDPVSWSNEPSHKWPINWIVDAEKTYKVFLLNCSKAGPLQCPLTEYKDEPLQHLERRFEEFFDAIALKPIPVPFGNRPGVLTSGGARGVLEISLQRPLSWPKAAEIFASAMAGNATELYNLVIRATPLTELDSPDPFISPRLAVTCLDSPRPASPDEFPTAEDLTEQGLKALREVSPHFGLSTSVSEPDGGCQYWPVDGPERFAGPWNATLETKMLIISNTADPITPKSSGLLVNSLMPDSSVIIIQDGPGHCSIFLPSLCTAKLQRGYFAGEMPKNGTVCPVDVATFPNEESDKHVQALSKDDLELLDALKDLEASF
ncbi:hypothetical protein J3R30DRAFT_3554813 [Lentinula aciculospora]|uniref:Alpha/beta-hydrolase n=1 Tax=Lentinula aciculospora TaxID=153920 RepID=A0A9W9DG07_9AGAR|nr:hypothetical protein J3R30DRAFT_3554813 [Lentinula aciculospora]